MKYLSTFTGIGGFELGIIKAHEKLRTQNEGQGLQGVGSEEGQSRERPDLSAVGLTCVGYSEIDKYASQIYQKHFPTHHNYGDITKIVAEDLPDFDLLVGGFPCQAFSIAGKRKGFDDTRGTLFFDLARILRAKQPRLFVFENVKGLLSHDNGQTFATIISTIDELGYDCQWQVLNSKNHGVPQNRERVFIIGHLRGTPRPQVFPIGGNDGTATDVQRHVANTLTARYEGAQATGTYIEEGKFDAQELKYVGAVMSENNKKWLDDGKVLSRNFPQGQRVYGTDGISATLASQAGGLGAKTGLYAVLTPDRLEKRQNGRRFKEDGEPSFTLTSQDKHGIYDGMEIRRLTPKECERLQGFPDNWTEGISDTQRYKCLGNAVTTNVIRDVMEKIL